MDDVRTAPRFDCRQPLRILPQLLPFRIGSGEVALILDVNSLGELVTQDRAEASPRAAASDAS